MKKQLLLIALILLPFGIKGASPASQEILRQLARNAHGGVEIHTIDGRISYSGYVGTAYVYYFYKNKAYLKPQIDVKWGQYKYQGDYRVETTSILIPVTVGYNLVQGEFLGIHIFGGGRYEQILHSAYNNYESGVNKSQAGLTAGTSIRLLNFVSLNISYYHALTALFKDDSGRVSSFNFSFNF